MTATYKRHPDIQTTALTDGHVVLLSTKTDWANTLSPLAALVWEFSDGSKSVDQVIESIKALDEISFQGDIREDVYALVSELDEGGFLVKC